MLKLAFTGETFSYAGKRYNFQDVKIAPGYVQPGGPPLWVAAMSEAGALRAARFGANLLPQGPRAAVARSVGSEAEGGRPRSVRRIASASSSPAWSPTIASATGRKVRVAERRRMDIYHRFREEAGGHGGVQGIAEADRIPQTWVVGDVEHCVKELAAFIREYGLTDIVTWAVPPGLTPDETNASLERFARDVAPRLRAMFGSP